MRATSIDAPRIDAVAWGLLLVLGLIWGGAFAVAGVAAQALPPLTIAACRLLTAVAVLAPLALAAGVRLPRLDQPDGPAFWRYAALAGLFSNALPFALLAWALAHVPSGLGGVLMATMPLMVLPLAAYFVPGERATSTKILGFVVGFLGVVWLIGPDALTSLGGDATSVAAQLACVAAALCYAIGSVVSARAPRMQPIGFAVASCGAGAAMIAPLALVLEAPFSADWSPAAAGAVIWLGLVPTGLATVLLLDVLRRRGPTFLALVNYQIPLWALAIGVWVMGETAPDRVGVALALILLGVAIAQRRPGAA